MSDISPWWYAECYAIYPANCATLIYYFNPLLKHAYNTFLWPGLNPSIIEPIDRELSACEKWINYLLTKSLYLTLGTLY